MGVDKDKAKKRKEGKMSRRGRELVNKSGGICSFKQTSEKLFTELMFLQFQTSFSWFILH